MLSRVAENVYWLSRYLERMEITARLMKVYGRTLMDMPHVQPHEGWMPLITISGCLLYTSPSPRDKRQSRMPSSA